MGSAKERKTKEAKTTNQTKRMMGHRWWRTVIVALAWLALYFDVIRRLIGDWRDDENYSHGFLIPLVGIYAIWRDRGRLAAIPIIPQMPFGLVLLAAAVLMLFAGIAGAELFLTRISLILSLAALALFFGGRAWLRRLAFPIGLLLLAIPIPSIVFNQIAFPMQLAASDLATRAIRWFGIPALREGNVIELANIKLQVVEACSGIRSLVSLTALVVVYVYFNENAWWRRVVLLVSIIPVALFANAARVAGTAFVAHKYGSRAAEGFLHGFSGLLVFAFALILIFLVAHILRRIEVGVGS